MNEVIKIQDKYHRIIPYRGKGYQYRPLAIKTILILFLCAFLIIYLNKKIPFYIPFLSVLPLVILLMIYLFKIKKKKEEAQREVLITFKDDGVVLVYPKTPAYDKNYNETMQKEVYTCSYKDLKTINEDVRDNRIEIYGRFNIEITKEIEPNYLWEEERSTVRGIYPSTKKESEILKSALQKYAKKKINQYGK